MKLRILSSLAIVLMISSLFMGMSSPVSATNYIPDSVPVTEVDRFNQAIENVDQKLMGGLDQFMETGRIPDNFTDRILVFSSTDSLKFDTFIPAINLGNSYLHFVDSPTPNKIRTLYLDPTVRVAFPDSKVDHTQNDKIINPEDGGLSSDSFQADDILNTNKVYDEYGFTGDGVTIGVVDSGVDFGITDLVDSAKLNSEGYLASFDVTGTGLAITGLTTSIITSQGKTLLPLADESLDVFVGEQGSIQSSSSLGLQLDDLDISNIEETSVSGQYKVGIARQGTLVQSLPTQYFLFVLVDSTTSGVYDTIYVDMETSLAITLAQAGIIFTSGSTFLQLNEFNLNNDEPFGPNNPIPAKDITGDGVNDVSMGGLGTVVDYTGVSGGPIVNGIDPDGNAIGMFYDPVGHGTLVASSAASNGTTQFPLYDNKLTDEVENGTTYPLVGSAPGVKIVGHKAFSLSEFALGWLWTGGLSLEETSEGLEWVEDPDNLVDISSNSWGNGVVAPDGYLKGFDPYSLTLDYLSTQDALYDGYPGMVFVVSGGNGAPGYGTAASPGMASMAITVGASTYYHYLDGATGRNDVAWFSARGPSGYGIVKPDIITPGHTGFVNVQVVQGYGNGTYASGTFGGTSEAAPRATGVLALMMEAYQSVGGQATLENLRLVLKATATDLGFDPTQQGAGLANAYKAVKSIVENEVIISSTYSSELAGANLQDAYFRSYQSNHPLVENPMADIVTTITPEQLENGINLDIRYSNGSIINSTEYTSELTRSELNFEENLSLTSTAISVDREISSLFPTNLGEYDFMELSLTMTDETWELFADNGLNTPNITLYDRGSLDIVADQFSRNTWGQLLYAGLPGEDFTGNPALRFTDPGYQNSISNWPGMEYNIHSRFFSNTKLTNVTISENNGSIAINSTQPNELQVWKLNVSVNGSTYPVPILISPTHQADYTDNLEEIGKDLEVTQPYNQFEVTNTFDWGYRPESGDFNHYRVEVPNDATFLASFVQWQNVGLEPNVYLFNSTGDLVTQTDTEYIGGGFYSTETSEPNSQNLLVPADDDTYYLMVHTTQLPFEAGPFEIDVFFRYLTIPKFPTPEPRYSQSISSALSGAFGIDVSNYSIEEFPEFTINSVSAQIYRGSNGSIQETVASSELNPGINEEFERNEFDDEITLNFEQGEKVELNLILEEDVDADMYVFPVGELIFRENDLLTGLGASSGAVDETGRFAVEETGDYVIYIDYIGNAGKGGNFNYELVYESRDGPTFSVDDDLLTFNTILFPDGDYGMLMTFYSNFGTSFQVRVTITTENTDNFEFSVLSPSDGAILEENVVVSWESSRQVFVDIYVKIDGSLFLVGDDITGTSHSFDSTIYSNGPAEIRVEATDEIYTQSVNIPVSFDNNDVSTLPEIQSSQVNDLPVPMSIMFLIFILPVIRKKKND